MKSGNTHSPRPLLVVDDDCDARDSLRDFLESEGFTVVCVNNGEEALSYLHRNPAPAAILVDLFMPVMNGWKLVQKINEQSSLQSLPIVIVTAQQPHWGYPAPHVIRKPIDPDELLRTVRALVEPSSGIAA